MVSKQEMTDSSAALEPKSSKHYDGWKPFILVSHQQSYLINRALLA